VFRKNVLPPSPGWKESAWYLIVTVNVVHNALILSTLITDLIYFSVTSVITKASWYNIPQEDSSQSTCLRYCGRPIERYANRK
jgi:hypothetical protein